MGTTEGGPGASAERESLQRRQRVLPWVTPALSVVLIVLAAQQGEQQRPIAGWLARFTPPAG